MPYLHWETDRNRAQMVEVIDELAILREENRTKDRRDMKSKRKRREEENRTKWKNAKKNWEDVRRRRSGETQPSQDRSDSENTDAELVPNGNDAYATPSTAGSKANGTVTRTRRPASSRLVSNTKS